VVLVSGKGHIYQCVDIMFMDIYLGKFCTPYYGQGCHSPYTLKLTAASRYFSLRLVRFRQGEWSESLDLSVSYLNGRGRWNEQMSQATRLLCHATRRFQRHVQKLRFDVAWSELQRQRSNSSPYQRGNFSGIAVERVVCMKNCRRQLGAAYITAMEINNSVKSKKMSQDRKSCNSNRYNLVIGNSQKIWLRRSKNTR